MAAFFDDLQDADRYRVERFDEAGAAGQYTLATSAHVIDLLDQRAQTTQTFDVSDERMWALLAGDDEDAIERYKWLRPQTIVDFSGERPVTYMTFLGPHGWDGKWMVADPDELAAVEDGAVLADQLERVAITDFVFPLLKLATLDPSGFDPTTQQLQYDVPARIARYWLPGRLTIHLQQAGIDPDSLRSPAKAIITPVSGGIEGDLNLTAMVLEAADLLSDAAEVDEAQQTSTVVMRIYGLGGGLPIRLPAPASIVTEVPVTPAP